MLKCAFDRTIIGLSTWWLMSPWR